MQLACNAINVTVALPVVKKKTHTPCLRPAMQQNVARKIEIFSTL